MSAYTRLLNLLEADRKAAVSKAGFALGTESIKEAQDLASKEADIQKEIRRIEKENRKRSGRKGLGGLLGGALGLALAGPLGIGTGLASGLGSLVGTRAAGARNRVEGIDPNLTLAENALFFKGQRENIENVVGDINAQLDEQSRNELTTDILSSIATGATGARFGKGELGQKISGKAGNLFESLTGRESLDLGKKISGLTDRAGQRFGNLFGGQGFVTDAETAGGIFAGRVEKAARDMSIGLDRGLLFDRPNMLAEEALADRFSFQKNPYAGGVRGLAADIDFNLLPSLAKGRSMVGQQLMAQEAENKLIENLLSPNLLTYDADIIQGRGGLPNINSLLAQYGGGSDSRLMTTPLMQQYGFGL